MEPRDRSPATARCACFHLRRATRAVTQLYDEALRPAGIRATQLALLSVLRERSPVNIVELSEILGLDRTTLTRNLGPLERDALLTIEPGADRRTREVSITEAGRERLTVAVPLWRAAQETLRERLGGSFREVLDTLDEVAEAASH
ncbi:MAG TPA: winged helix-turn-helix transcriptional regulator [Thermoanaerobaculia bacterium]|nr:winged helix-turn-helix transcriptional regulator [Thermoanaerobaculia bacterium]